MKRIITIVITLSFILISGFGVYFWSFFKQIPNDQSSDNQIVEQKEIHLPCLSDDEYADYLRVRIGSFVPSAPLTVLIKDKNTENEKIRFNISDVRPSEAWPLNNHMFKCGFYVVRGFNFNLENLKTLPDFRKEIWKYQYNGNGDNILTLSYKDENGLDRFLYSDDFRIDETETNIALIKGWYGEPEEHALVIKDLETMEDKYVVTLKELMDRYPNVEPATISLEGWGNNFFQFSFLNSAHTFFTLDINKKEIIELWE